MKTVVYCAICVILTVLITAYWGNSFSEKHENQIIVEADKDLSPPFGAGPLVSIVWYKGNAHNPYKLISNSKHIDDILYRLQYKGNKEGSSTVQKPVSPDAKNLLAFVYYRPKEDSYRMRYIPFEIKDNIFYWEYGEDKKVAQILQESEIWNRDLHEPSRVIDEHLAKEKKAKEKYNIEKKQETINQVKEALADRDETENRDILKTCKLANQNLLEIESFAIRQEVLDEITSDLDTDDLKESVIHAFAQVHKWMLDEKYAIDSKHISTIEQFNQKYDDEGLDRDEQLKLFELHQLINKQILDELHRIQDDFEEILQINESQQYLRRQIQKRMAEREVKAQKKIEELK